MVPLYLYLDAVKLSAGLQAMRFTDQRLYGNFTRGFVLLGGASRCTDPVRFGMKSLKGDV